jgi:hypothetical protein
MSLPRSLFVSNAAINMASSYPRALFVSIAAWPCFQRLRRAAGVCARFHAAGVRAASLQPLRQDPWHQ